MTAREDPDAAFARGMSAASASAYGEAAEHFLVAIGLSPLHFEAQNQLFFIAGSVPRHEAKQVLDAWAWVMGGASLTETTAKVSAGWSDQPAGRVALRQLARALARAEAFEESIESLTAGTVDVNATESSFT